MPPFLSSPNATIDSGDIQDAVDTYLAANPLDLTDHLAASDPHTGYQLESQRGAANGYAPLDGSGLIADIRIPASIARDSEAQGYVTTHAAAADPHADRAFATSAIATHNSDTTSVHGIADTSLLATTANVTAAITNHNALSTNVHGVSDLSAVVLNTSTLLWPQRVFETDDQTEPPGAVEGDFWIAPEV